jgi:phytoene dehydrogenase-like protein
MGDAAGQRGLWGFVRGGMGAISNSLAASAQAHGATIRCNSRVEKILMKHGRAYGVALSGGEELKARLIISNADPKRTFLKLVDKDQVDDEFLEQMHSFKCEGSSVKINLALDGLPNFKAYPTNGGVALPHKTTMHVCPSMDYIDRAWEDALKGMPSENPMLECTIPSTYDDSVAPAGKHLMSMFVQYGPYTLKNLKWDSQLKDKFADRCLEIMSEYAPNIKDIVIHRQVISPLDMEKEYGLTGGSIFHGDMGLDQLFFMRPAPGWARAKTPIRNLYLCGSGLHPGGGVMGAPGYNAACEILKDKRRGHID